MPTYEYQCKDCNQTFERILTLKEYKVPQVCVCGSKNTHKIFTTCNFVLRGDSWPGKAIRISNQMRDKNKRLAGRQEERKRAEPGVSLVPNVGGERVENWREAQKLARSKGKDTESYEPLIQKERAL